MPSQDIDTRPTALIEPLHNHDLHTENMTATKSTITHKNEAQYIGSVPMPRLDPLFSVFLWIFVLRVAAVFSMS
jgi:hypothetical protein